MRLSDWSSDVCSSDLRPSLQAAYVIGAMHGDLARSACAIGCKRLFDQTQHWIVDHSPFHMNAPDMSACVGPVLFRHDPPQCGEVGGFGARRSEEHTSELQSLMRISYAVFCLKKKRK